jgi:hypothetical protein
MEEGEEEIKYNFCMMLDVNDVDTDWGFLGYDVMWYGVVKNVSEERTASIFNHFYVILIARIIVRL